MHRTSPQNMKSGVWRLGDIANALDAAELAQPEWAAACDYFRVLYGIERPAQRPPTITVSRSHHLLGDVE